VLSVIRNEKSNVRSESRKQKLALLVNMISPARIPLYSALAERFDLLVLHGGNEANRKSWRQTERMLPGARVIKAWGWQIPLTRKVNGRVFDRRLLHITPGFLWHLFRFRPDVLISNEMGLRTLIALAYSSVTRKPVWIWWGGTPHTERGIGTGKRLVRKLISRWADRWISYGKSSTDYLCSLGVSRKSVLEIQNSVDERSFLEAGIPALEIKPRPVLLHVGQFTARKGISLLLHAAAELQKRGRVFSLVFVGSGPEKIAAQQLSQKLGLKNVRFMDEQTPAAMPSIYKSADVFIFPTLEDVWGLVANEAALSGLSVLCSKFAGCAEELFGPENIFDPQNQSEFVEKLGYALTLRLPRANLTRLRFTSDLAASLVHALLRSDSADSLRLPRE